MNHSEYLPLIEEIFEEDPGAISVSDTLDELGWDSISFMSFIAAMEDNFGIMIAPTELTQCSTVEDLIQLAAKRRNQ